MTQSDNRIMLYRNVFDIIKLPSIHRSLSKTIKTHTLTHTYICEIFFYFFYNDERKNNIKKMSEQEIEFHHFNLPINNDFNFLFNDYY